MKKSLGESEMKRREREGGRWEGEVEEGAERYILRKVLVEKLGLGFRVGGFRLRKVRWRSWVQGLGFRLRKVLLEQLGLGFRV